MAHPHSALVKGVFQLARAFLEHMDVGGALEVHLLARSIVYPASLVGAKYLIG